MANHIDGPPLLRALGPHRRKAIILSGKGYRPTKFRGPLWIPAYPSNSSKLTSSYAETSIDTSGRLSHTVSGDHRHPF